MNELDKLKSMNIGNHHYINWFEGGGGEVVKVDKFWFLNEIPQFGGSPLSISAYKEDELQDLIDTANGWT